MYTGRGPGRERGQGRGWEWKEAGCWSEKPSVPIYLTGDFLMARSGLYPIKIISKDPGDTEAGIKQQWLWFQFQVPMSVEDRLQWPRKNSREATHSEYK